MMKLAVSLTVAAVAIAIAGASFLDILTRVHNSNGFKQLSSTDKIVFLELVAETHEGELEAYIDKVGFARVLAVIDHLPSPDDHQLTAALIKELNIEHHVTTTGAPVHAVGKKDTDSMLQTLLASVAYQHLSSDDQRVLVEIVKAAGNDTLNSLIHQIGYATVLRLVDHLIQHDAHRLSSFITQNLKQEAGSHST